MTKQVKSNGLPAQYVFYQGVCIHDVARAAARGVASAAAGGVASAAARGVASAARNINNEHK